MRKDTRKRIESAISEYDYVPSALAKQLAKDSNSLLGVILPEIDNPFFSGIIKGINEVADAHGLSVILCGSNEDMDKEMRIIRTLKGQRILGILVTAAAGENKQTEEYKNVFKTLDIPVVLIDRGILGTDFDSVFVDDMQAIYEITSLMLDEGHRHIEILAGNPDMYLGQNRTNGYIKAFAERGIQYREEWIHYSLFTQQAGYETTHTMLSRNKSEWPTAIVANNNMLTLGALSAIFEKELRIPRDIAFAGYDQIDILQVLHIDITLAEKSTVEIGKTAMKMLYERIIDKTEGRESTASRRVMLKAKLMVRGSEKMPVR